MKSIEEILQKAVQDKVFPGAVVGWITKNGEHGIIPFGTFTYDEGATSMQEDSIFDIASLTKTLPTACIAMQLIDEGILQLDDQVIAYIPELTNAHREQILIRHLLTYSILLDLKQPLSAHKHLSADELLHVIFNTELAFAPGEKFHYSNTPAILLGLVIERVCQKRLDELAEERFFQPLHMKHTTFHPKTLDPSTIVPTEQDPWRGEVRGFVHDESAYILQQKYIPGCAGVFSNAPDLLRFLSMMLNNGVLDGKQYFSEYMMRQMQTNQLQIENTCTGLGWELHQSRYMGKYSHPQLIAKTGFTGCVMMCDREKEIGFVLLSNRIYPARPTDAESINAIRSQIADVIFSPDFIKKQHDIT